MKWSAGCKSSFIYNSSDIDLTQIIDHQEVIDSAYINKYRYNEQTAAAFINTSGSTGKLAYQIGLRTEATWIKGESLFSSEFNKDQYTRVFPTAYLTYEGGQHNVIAINYGRRINRPDYSLMNPFKYYYSPYTYSEGNPFLRPSYNHNIELSHVYKGVFTSTLSYSLEQNGFGYVTFLKEGSDFQVNKQ